MFSTFERGKSRERKGGRGLTVRDSKNGENIVWHISISERETFFPRISSFFAAAFIYCSAEIQQRITEREVRETNRENWAQQRKRDERWDKRSKTRGETRRESEKHKKCLPENSAKFSFFPTLVSYFFSLCFSSPLSLSLLLLFLFHIVVSVAEGKIPAR